MTDPESGLLGADEPRLFPLYPGRPASSSSSVLISFLLFFGGWVRGGGVARKRRDECVLTCASRRLLRQLMPLRKGIDTL